MLVCMAHTVHVPSPLRSYTGGASRVSAAGADLHALLADLEVHHRGLRFRMIDEQDRIRRHIRIFINTREALTLDAALLPADEVHLVCALSGG
jgi:molybdopterin converting factor small subunit